MPAGLDPLPPPPLGTFVAALRSVEPSQVERAHRRERQRPAVRGCSLTMVLCGHGVVPCTAGGYWVPLALLPLRCRASVPELGMGLGAAEKRARDAVLCCGVLWAMRGGPLNQSHRQGQSSAHSGDKAIGIVHTRDSVIGR